MKNRNANVEILRIIAMLMVVSLHTFGKGVAGGGELCPGHFLYIPMWLVKALCYCAVDVFYFVSAWYLCRQAFRWGRILRLWCVIVFYSVGIWGICVAAGIVDFSFYSLLTSCMPIAFRKYGFATGYLGMCFTAPILNILYGKLTQKEHLKVVMVLLLLSAIYPMLTGWQIIFFQEGNTYGLALVIYSIAAYMRKYGVAHKAGWWLSGYFIACAIHGGVGILLGISTKLLLGRNLGEGVLMHYNSLTVLASAVCLSMGFLSMKEDRISDGIKSICLAVSGTTFAIFLIHEHPDLRGYFWEQWRANVSDYRTWGGVILVTIPAIFLTGMLLDWARQLVFRILYIDKLVEKVGKKLDDLSIAVLTKMENKIIKI